MNSYIFEERVINRAMEPYPKIPQLVDFSTPVVSFGYPKDAQIATLGINPSSNEFQKGNGNKNPLPLGQKRLIDTETLGIRNPISLNHDQALEVISGCYSYFEAGSNPYDWFDNLQKHVLNPINSSFLSGDACHLDLVQWATDPVWQHKDMPKATKKLLLESDKEFLKFQLTNYDFKYLFLNGSTVIEQVKKLKIVSLESVHEVPFNSTGVMSQVLRGKMGNTVVIGWGLNVGYGATFSKGLAELTEWLEANVSL